MTPRIAESLTASEHSLHEGAEVIDTTTDVPGFSFLIHSTSNNGVHFSLWSNGKRDDGWSYGTLRNDVHETGPAAAWMIRIIRLCFRDQS